MSNLPLNTVINLNMVGEIGPYSSKTNEHRTLIFALLFSSYEGLPLYDIIMHFYSADT